MTDVQLGGTLWSLGRPLGAGGFGQVFLSKNTEGEEVAVKVVPGSPGAARETLIAEQLPSSDHLMPILTSGRAADGSYVMVMPLADSSLAQQTTPIHTEVALGILLDIAHGLAALQAAGVVHRDLKPDNVLLYDGSWRLSDFGIARIAEADTTTYTHKFAHSAPYTAPERWRQETAGFPADVYSFGVIAFELLSGVRPFPGPKPLLREQHLFRNAPDLTVGPKRIRLLVEQCLLKTPAARPTIDGIIAQITRAIAEPPATPGRAALAKANLAVARAQSASEARDSAVADRAIQRAELHADAARLHSRIADELLESIKDQAAIAKIRLGTGQTAERYTVMLGHGRLGLTEARPVEKWNGGFDLISHATIAVRCDNGHARSHNLWYCDAQSVGEYQWFETAFMDNPMAAIVQMGDYSAPYCIDPVEDREDAEQALSRVIGLRQVAWPFGVIQPSDLQEFIDRWSHWLATCADGTYRRPSTMPEKNPAGSWRQ